MDVKGSGIYLFLTIIPARVCKDWISYGTPQEFWSSNRVSSQEPLEYEEGVISTKIASQ